MIKFNILCLVLLFSGLVVADNVPVLLWGPFDHYTPATALKSYNAEEFVDILGQHVTPDTFAVVFSENQLTTEDLTQCRTPEGRTCFQGMQKIKSKLYLSSVEDPVAIIDDVAGLDHVDVTISADGTLSQPINTAGGKFNFVSFEDGASDETKSVKLARHDQFISALSNELSAQNLKLLVIYTGKRSVHQRHVRQVPAANATVAATTTTTTTAASPVIPKQEDTAGTPTFFNDTRMLLYYTGFYVVQGTEDRPVVFTRTTVAEISANILGVEMSGDGTNIFKFNITEDSGYWWVNEFSWNDRALISDTRVYALETFSFHCSPIISLKSGGEVLLKWRGLQVEPRFSVLADQPFDAFGDSWDCVGFVSPGILGGLFVVIMLLFILSIGISWMMEINTMDRFDDPKGKTITINASD